MNEPAVNTNDIDQEQVSFKLILHGGNARAESFLALDEAKKGNWDEAKKHIKNAEEEMKLAHEVQTNILQAFASGLNVIPNLLLVHAQDHLMTAKSEMALIEELIEVYKKNTKQAEEKH